MARKKAAPAKRELTPLEQKWERLSRLHEPEHEPEPEQEPEQEKKEED